MPAHQNDPSSDSEPQGSYIQQPSREVSFAAARDAAGESILSAADRRRLAAADVATLRTKIAAANAQPTRNKMAAAYVAAWAWLVRKLPRGHVDGEVGWDYWLGSPEEYLAIARQLDDAWLRLSRDASGTSASSFIVAERAAWMADSARIQQSLMQRLWTTTGRVLDAWERRYAAAQQRVLSVSDRPATAPAAETLQRRSPTLWEETTNAMDRPFAGLAGLGGLVVVGGLLFVVAKLWR